MTHFISYVSNNEEFGYMCYTGTMTEAWLKDKLFTKDLTILFISGFKEGNKILVSFVTNDKFKHEVLNRPMEDVDELCDVWLYLKRKYNDVHILSFKVLTDELM